MKRDFFTYRNLRGDIGSLGEDIRLGTPTAVFGVSDEYKYLLASLTEGPLLYITPDALTAAKAYEAISVLSGKKCVLLPAKDEVVLYKDALSKDVVFRRICAVYEVLCHAEYVICDVESAFQLLSDRIESIIFKTGEDINYSSLSARLVSMGYSREYSADSKGTFAVHGDIINIYPINCENPVRIDFFGDTVEKIRPYDFVTGERLEDVNELIVISACDFTVDRVDNDFIRKTLSAEIKKCPDAKAYSRAKNIADEINEKLNAGVPFSGVSFLAPLLSCAKTIFDIISPETLIVFDECKLISEKANALFSEHSERVSSLKKGGEAFSFSLAQMLQPESFYQKTSSFKRIAVQNFASSTFFFSPLKTYNLRSTPAPSYLNNLPQLSTDVRRWLDSDYKVIIFTGSSERASRLSQTLTEEYLPVYTLPDRAEALQGVCVSAENLAKGLVLHESKIVLVGANELYVKSAPKRVRRRRGDMFISPEIGDYCVHEKHGIGKIVGVKKIETGDGIKEYVAVEYKAGDMLYVPVEQMDILSKYVGEDNPPLSKIGGADFERVKERVRQSIKKMAFDLKELYAERSKKNGFNFPENAVMMEEFENSFVYEETPDQLSSIAEIKADMCSDKVMDRLLCGDVGYGKTEVALRAIYLCVLGGKQAALMCPSTILSEQHYNTACERFAPFGVRVEKLNRFKTAAQQAETLKQLKNGDIDLIVGTHRLLSSDVKFNDLGLLVLDEEQRFGVEHKEKIKHIKKDVDCLTMTATPIPRTLHMSLSGIRDISTINTPPQKRLPVQTYVTEESETLIRDACIREISRGGQVFILYNRVESIARYAENISHIIPEAKVTYAHGRMDKDTLENNIYSFYRGEKDILVTTTIIENGIDLPNVNTIIVIDADRLGISQLYQLRGRVGRGTRLAQAYFTFKADKILTSDATERLKAIMRFTELGSGFKIAMRDLEIRGAGNVLGAEQHGHMDKVGYELYSKLLKEELTGERQEACELEIAASAYIPESFIESSAGRLDCYKQIAEIRGTDDFKRVYTSIEDNYGKIPQEVMNLLVIAVLKSYACKFNVRKICVNSEEGTLELPSVDSLKDGRLYSALEKFSDKAKLSMAKLPLIAFESSKNCAYTMREMTKFLKFALTFNKIGEK